MRVISGIERAPIIAPARGDESNRTRWIGITEILSNESAAAVTSEERHKQTVSGIG